MGLDVVPLVERACQVDRAVLVTMDREDLLGLGLDMPDEVDQLPPVRMAREPVNRDDLEVDHDRPAPPGGNLAPAFLDPPAHRAVSLVPDKDECIALIGCQAAQVLHHRAPVQHPARRDDNARVTVDHPFTQVSGIDLDEAFGKERVQTLLEDLVPEFIVQVLGVGGVDRCCLAYHPVKVDPDRRDLLFPDPLFERQHHFLGTPDRERRDDHFPPASDD